MSMIHSFKVSASKGAEEHNVKVTVPTWNEATEAQRRNAWDAAISSWTISVQSGLRKPVGDRGLRGDALNADAQRRFDAKVNGTRANGGTVVDATALGLNREQIDALVAAGATVVNIPAKLAGK